MLLYRDCPLLDDVMFDVLLRLPMKTLILCKLVCRSWRSMIEDSFFVSEHLKLSALRCSTARTHLTRVSLAEECVGKLVIASIPGSDSVRLLTAGEIPRDTNQPTWIDRIVGSFNGVVCVSRCRQEKLFIRDEPWQTYLWNPTTREYQVLPRGLMHSNWTPLVYGFGYNPIAGDYKVVRFTVDFDLTLRSCAEVFSLNDGLWREVCAPDDQIGLRRESETWYQLHQDMVECAQLDGVLYWAALVGYGYDGELEQILSFDLGSEEFGLASLPLFADNGHGFRKLAVHNSTLCFIVHGGKFSDCFNLWVRNARGKGEVDGAWTRLVSIGPFNGVMRPLGFGINGEVFMERVSNGAGVFDGEVIVYEPRTGRARGLCYRLFGHRAPFHFYTESLVPLAPKGTLRTFL